MSDFAPEYTRKERIILVAKILTWVIPLYLVAKFWLNDWLAEYAADANCHKYGSINGGHLVFYGVFVFSPLFLAALIFIIEGRRSIKVIKLGQNPLPNEKVLRPTKYKYGAAAKIQPIGVFCIMLFLVGLSIWGGFQAYELAKNIKPCAPEKTKNLFGVKRVPPGVAQPFVYCTKARQNLSHNSKRMQHRIVFSGRP